MVQNHVSSPNKLKRLYLYLTFSVLVVFNIILLRNNYLKEHELQNLRQMDFTNQVLIRTLRAEVVFGAPFVSFFRTVNLQEQPETIPDFGSDRVLLLFFESWNCRSCLEAMASFKSVIGDDIKVIGVAQTDSAAKIMPFIEDYGYEFPVYLAVDSPFNLNYTSYAVLIDGNRNVMHLASLDPSIKPVSELISEIVQFIERR